MDLNDVFLAKSLQVAEARQVTYFDTTAEYALKYLCGLNWKWPYATAIPWTKRESEQVQ
jgi:hypothetical protein